MGNTASSTAPWAAQIALVNTDLICYRQSPFDTGSGYGGQNITASITAPLTAGAGQQIYFSDLAGSFQIPDVFLDLASSQQASYYSVSYLATFDTNSQSNARGLSQNAWEISGTVFKPFSDPSVPIPSSGGIYQPLGPATMDVLGSVTDFRFANLTYTMNFADQANQATSSSFTVTCGRTQLLGDNYLRPIIASTVTSNSSVANYRLAPANGVKGSFPPTAFREKSVTANLDIACNWGTNLGFNMTVTGTGPAVTASGRTISLRNWQNVWTLPAKWFGIVMTRGLHGFVFTTDVDVNGANLPGPGIGMQLDNASPSSIDISRQFVASDSTTGAPLSAGRYINVTDYQSESLPFPLPLHGDLTLGPFTAGDAYKVFGANVTNLQGEMYIYSYQSNVGFKNLPFRCTSGPNALLRTAMIF